LNLQGDNAVRKNGEKNEQGFKKLRNRAEQSLPKGSADLGKSPVEDTRKLIHELRVHQIELEMQSEELRKAQVELAKLTAANAQLQKEIEEGKQAEKDLQVALHKLQGILEAMNDGVYIANKHYDIEYANPVIEKEFGPVKGRKCYEYFHDRKEVCPWCKSQEVFAGKSVQREWHSSITGKTYELFDTPVPNAYGTISKLAIFHEITGRKQAEEALRESEMKYRIVADNTYDWEWWRDPEGNFIYVSPSCKDVTHHAAEEFAADPELLFRIIHPDDQSSFSRHELDVEEKRFSGEMEFRILRPDGSIRWIAHACQSVFDEQGRFLGHRGSNRDITEHKEAEEAVRESEERYRTLVETMNQGLGIADEKEVWTYVNETFCMMLGYSFDELIGRPLHDWLDEANREILSEQVIKRRRGDLEPYEIAWIRKDGSTVHTLVSPKPILSADGRFQGSFAVITDITKRKKTEESLRKALLEIESLKERFEAENIYLRQESKMRHGFSHIIGNSNAFKYVLYRAEQVAPTKTTVLILGETGTGKELVAEAIHQMSPRKDRALVTVNCAALPPNLIESELFGREKGAYTGADSRQLGRFDIANNSTLLLDEIGELPMEVQAKLLRTIQHNEFERLGSSRTIRVDVRIVATTNRDLDEAVRKRQFRQDLYYRLNVFPVTVPPLRQRKDDIPLLAKAFIERYARGLGKGFTSIQKETMKVLQDYDWPGNVRELENVIERAAILCPGPVFHLADELRNSALSHTAGLRTMEETERDQILKTLSETRWRINGKKGAAAILGLHPSTLRARMHKLGIRRPEIKTQD